MVGVSSGSISTLLFTRNNLDRISTLLSQLISFSDEVVIVDSSDPRFSGLRESVLQLSSKVKIYLAPALGYVEPLRMYGISKCTGDWIFNIDSDELLSEELARDMRSIVANSTFECFSILRYNKTMGGKVVNKEYISNRLFKSNLFTYKGYIHEPPIFSGRLKKLSPQHCISHFHEEFSKDILREIPVETYYNRIAYCDLLNEAQIANRVKSPALCRAIQVYARLKGKDPSCELTLLDYLMYAFSFLLPLVNPLNWPFAGSRIEFFRYQTIKFVSFHKTGKQEHEMQFALARSIRKAGGVIRFLSLDDEGVIGELYSRFVTFNGTPDEFFISLLVERGRAT